MDIVKKIVEGLEECQGEQNCKMCPYVEEYNCIERLREDALYVINEQQKILANIDKLIINNTYPGFDKNGKSVSIWKADGYEKIIEEVKKWN